MKPAAELTLCDIMKKEGFNWKQHFKVLKLMQKDGKIEKLEIHYKNTFGLTTEFTAIYFVGDDYVKVKSTEHEYTIVPYENICVVDVFLHSDEKVDKKKTKKTDRSGPCARW